MTTLGINGARNPFPPTDSLFDGLPMWARILSMVGIQGTIAFFLVYVGAMTVPKLQQEIQAIRIETDQNRAAIERQFQQGEQTYRMLQRICSNLAKNNDERNRCFDR